MRIGLYLAHGLAPHAPPLPVALADVERRAEFVKQVNRMLLVDGEGVARWADMGRHLADAATASDKVMPEVTDPLERVSVALRLWAGCLTAAKAIAYDTRSGANAATGRAHAFAEGIDQQAAADPVFRAGVEAAPAFHALHGDPCFLDGVPTDSPVRTYAERCSEGRDDAGQ
jgi:hypothetical protein